MKKKQDDRDKRLAQLYEKIERDDEELLRLLDETDEENDDDDEYDDEYYEDDEDDNDDIVINYTPPVNPISVNPQKVELETPATKHSPAIFLIFLLGIIFLVTLIYTLGKLIFAQELHLVSLTICAISFIVMEILAWKRR